MRDEGLLTFLPGTPLVSVTAILTLPRWLRTRRAAKTLFVETVFLGHRPAYVNGLLTASQGTGNLPHHAQPAPNWSGRRRFAMASAALPERALTLTERHAWGAH